MERRRRRKKRNKDQYQLFSENNKGGKVEVKTVTCEQKRKEKKKGENIQGTTCHSAS